MKKNEIVCHKKRYMRRIAFQSSDLFHWKTYKI